MALVGHTHIRCERHAFREFGAFFVTLGAWLLFKERVTPLFLLAMAAALLGTTMVVGSSLEFDRIHVVGDAIGVVTGMFWAAYQLTVKHLRRRLSAATIMMWSTLVTAVALLPLAILSDEALMAPTLYGWGILLALAWLSHAGGQGRSPMPLPTYRLPSLRWSFCLSRWSLPCWLGLSSVRPWVPCKPQVAPWFSPRSLLRGAPRKVQVVASIERTSSRERLRATSGG